jgi:hypothetical protein
MWILPHLPQSPRLAVEAVSPVLTLEAFLAALSGSQAAARAADPRGDRSLAALRARGNCA